MRHAPNVTLSLLSFLFVSSCGSGSGPVEQPPPNQTRTPSPSAGHALVYHSGLGAVLLVNSGLGGMNAPPSTARTILWKWSDSTWEVVDSAGPPVRNLGGVAYDSHRNALVLFGGSYRSATVMQLNGQTWTTTTDAGPGARYLPAIAFDPSRNVTVLFGGGNPGNNELYADTWELTAGTGWRKVK